MSLPWFVISCLFGSIALTGCAQPHLCLKHDDATIRLHVISVDSDGVARNPVNFSQKLKPKEFRAQVADMLDAMDQFHGDRYQGETAKKLLIFVHGGLNSPKDSLSAADNELDEIQKDHYYPIFVNWQSDLIDSYGEHITSVTQGLKEYQNPTWRAVVSPLFLGADVVRAIGRAPLVWINQGGSDIAAMSGDLEALSDCAGRSEHDRWSHYRGSANVERVFADLYEDYKEDLKKNTEATRQKIQISIEPDHDLSLRHLTGVFVSYWLTSPFKFGTSWIVDGLGKSAWDNMVRRTFVMFEGKVGANPHDTSLAVSELVGDKESVGRETPGTSLTTQQTRDQSAPPPLPDWDRVGAVEYLKNQLARRIHDHSPPHEAWEKYEITLIGHSMGAIVLNEWIRRNREPEDGMYYKNIVYMAAACSIRHFNDTVVPYLRTHKNSANPKGTTSFYNLTLHPTAELREKNRPWVGDLPARGSLLVWIDDFLSDPATSRDRTLGRWDNILPSVAAIPPEVRGQITIRAMSLDPNDKNCEQGKTASDPQTHGSFRCFPYWREEFWKARLPNATEDDICKRAKSAGRN